MYGQNRESSMDGLRAKLLRNIVGEDEKLTSKSKINLARLPPCQSAWKPHLQRLNHRVALYKRIHPGKIKTLRWWVRVDKDWRWSVVIGVVMWCSVTKLTDWSSGIWWSWRGRRRGGGEKRWWTGLTLTISVKMMVKMIYTYRMKPMRGWGAAAKKRSLWLAIYPNQ